jgi:hypothetical protein
MNNVTKYQVKKIKKNKKEGIEEIKRRDCYVHGGSHTCVFSMGGNALELPPLCNPP